MRYLTRQCRPAILLSLSLLVLCGLLYPLLVTLFSQILFPNQANGSLVSVSGQPVGSQIIGQAFTDPAYLQGRPSAVQYNTYSAKEKDEGVYQGVRSGSENLAPSNPALMERIRKDLAAFQKENPQVDSSQIPADLLTASGSGLDPHISIQAAAIQLERIEKASGLDRKSLEAILEKATERKFLGIFGEDKVHVLQANLQIAQKMGRLVP